MNPNLLATDRVAVLATVNPVSQGAGTVTTGWVDASKFASYAALIAAGVLGASATVDAKFQQATDSGGTGAKDVTGKAITQLVKATDDGKQAIINLRQPDLDIANGFTHIRVSLTVGTAASLVFAALLGLDPVNGKASDNDAASVKEIKV